MKPSIGSTIFSLRKEKGISKQELALSLGVDKKSIDSWERGDTYPDITLLTSIAKVLSTDVDSLLMFETSLTADQIMNINGICAEAFETMDYDSALKTCERYIEMYPNSLFLKFRIGSLFQEYIQMAGSEEKANQSIDRSIQLLEEASIIDDLEVKQASLYVLSSLYTMKQEYDKAIEVLNALPKMNMNTDFMLSTIYTISGETIKAKKIEQETLFNNITQTIISLTGMWGTALKEKDFDFAAELAEKQKKLIEDYDLESVLLGNNILIFADIAAVMQNEELTLNYIEDYVQWLLSLNEASSTLANNKLFSLLDDYSFDYSKDYIKSSFIDSVVKNEGYDFIKYTERYRRISAKIL